MPATRMPHENNDILPDWLKSHSQVSFEIHNNFLFPFWKDNKKMFDKFKNDEDEGGETMTQEPRPETAEQHSSTVETASQIGIGELMGKRAKLEEAIDYVGAMIKNLKDKRTMLEKDIEDESVDIKNLKEKLQKVGEYIDEENRGITELAEKRKRVETEADEVGTIINNLREKLSGVDRIIDDEGNRVKRIRESRESI